MPNIYIKRGLNNALTAVNPVLGSGEMVYVRDTNTIVVGNGSGVFSSLSGINATPLTHSHVVSDITNFNSSVSGLLPVKNITAGSGIGITSVNENFTINVTGSFGLTSEEVDDRVSNLLVAGTGISLNYDDNSNALSINLSSSSIKGYEILTSNKSVFTVTQGYLVNNLNVYINGVKLLDGVDYTATNGSTFTLTETAVSGNIVEWNGLGGVASYVTNISGSENIVATNNNGSFTISSSGLIKSDTTSIIGASGVTNIVVMSKTDYDSIVTKNPTTLYYIV